MITERGHPLPWPCFVLRLMECPEGTPAPARQALEMHGVPARAVGGEYIGSPEWLPIEGAPKFLMFGRSGITGRICLDVNSLEIVEIPGPGLARVNAVNSSLSAFSACVEAVIARFPYYTYDTVELAAEKVASQLREQLLKLDPTVGAQEGLWGTFLDDVAMGNYAVEEFARIQA